MIQMRRTVERNEEVAEHPDKPDCFLRLNIILTIPSTPLLKVQIVGTTKIDLISFRSDAKKYVIITW